MMRALSALLLLAAPLTAWSAVADSSPIALSMFAAIIVLTIAITLWAANRVRSVNDLYTAGGQISGFQNGLAICGDFMSAATFLGVVALAYVGNGEATIYIASPILGLAFLLLFVAEPLRNLGRYTIAQVMSLRFPRQSMQTFCAFAVLTVTLLYLIAQMVGAGALLQVLTGVSYKVAVVIVAVLMMSYVLFGGMLATTWVQIIKAVLLVACVVLLSFMVLVYFKYDLSSLYTSADVTLRSVLGEGGGGGALSTPFSALSLGIAMSFGMVGLPHLLIRFFTVPDALQARRSVLIATFIIAAVFLLMVFVLAYAAIVLVHGRPEFLGENGQLVGGVNMAVIHLSRVLGGEVMLGFVAAVTFATILAVVAGLTMAGAGALANDLYVQVVRKGKADEKTQVRAFRIATLVIAVFSVLLGIVFENQGIAYMVSLAFTVAASANFPVLILGLYWSGLTRRGAIAGGATGLILSVVLIVTGPTIWVSVLGNAEPLFPYAYPALLSMPLAFIVCLIASRLDPEYGDADARRVFNEMRSQAQRGVRVAAQAFSH